MYITKNVLNHLRNRSISLKHVRMKSRTALIPELDESLRQDIENGTVNFTNHTGINRPGLISLPDELVQAIISLLKDIPMKTINKDAEALHRYLVGRQPPVSRHEFRYKTAAICKEIENKIECGLIDFHGKTDEEIEGKATKYADLLLKSRVYAWKPIKYTSYIGKQYLVSRMAAEYAVLCKIFSEIKLRCPDFQLNTLYDFGSGVGTVLWAARKYWKNSINEYFCVDPSAEMHEISRSLLKATNMDKSSFSNIFYRQFFSPDSKIKYNVVICSYTLFELPSAESRLETLLKLWNRTENFLIIVDYGNINGFRLIHEARNFILEVEKTLECSLDVHIFAPCPHELDCPLVKISEKPCRFFVPYLSPPFGKRQVITKETFSYIVLKKGKRPEDDKQWPRIIRPTIKRHGHKICYLCTKEGNFNQIVCTKSKHGKTIYNCSKYLKLGDRFPIEITEVLDDFDELPTEVQDVTEDSDYDIKNA